MSMTENTPTTEAKAEQPPVVVKKYANRRLYNTESSSYITLDDLAVLVRKGRDFVVYDAKSGEDITRGVLTQIIVEEESKGQAMLPTAFLRQIIGFYGGNLQQLVPPYLEQAMSSFATQQEQVRTAVQQSMGNLFPGMQDIGRQNMAMMEQAMSLFSAFYRPGGAGSGAERPAEPDAGSPPEAVTALQSEIESLRRQLAAQTGTGPTAAEPGLAHEPFEEPKPGG